MYKLCPCCAKKVLFKLLKTTSTYFIIECECSYMDKIIINKSYPLNNINTNTNTNTNINTIKL